MQQQTWTKDKVSRIHETIAKAKVSGLIGEMESAGQRAIESIDEAMPSVDGPSRAQLGVIRLHIAKALDEIDTAGQLALHFAPPTEVDEGEVPAGSGVSVSMSMADDAGLTCAAKLPADKQQRFMRNWDAIDESPAAVERFHRRWNET